ncbi:Uncharacterised protein [Edwardsiella tarda]|uniref:Uncharacterized protein n=1 Tax=Edwardsiella tarda ATCC 15947 = NBRC 105688 TaxID=667121 RepID=A0AC61THR6_EDWTA|nr:hypothetical protein [Edwardsiella tarda]UCQ00219.1 hypothetical protein DCL27_16760 [Edwardsiella tarda ATCC 15947 = NBRC 105688]STD31741.1 Uncharacterised protein [Edwardsiella tarda]
MKPIADIALMAVVALGLIALGNTLFAWLLICLPLVYGAGQYWHEPPGAPSRPGCS